jgi:N-acetylmuramic acid 6-phosphate etherase
MPLPQTEMTHGSADSIDALAPSAALAEMLRGQMAAVSAVGQALPEIELGSALMADTLRANGSLVYVAAGSSGLMALADASELPATFGIPQNQIRICMAGGIPVDGAMPGDTEDDTTAAGRIADSLRAHDLVIALSASGTTPYPCEIAKRARQEGLRVIAIANNSGTELLGYADVAICLPTPPEVLAGSTRLGAGTAQKVALNMMSTLAGIRLGHVHDGMMVNLHADNKKLHQRIVRIVCAIAGVDEEAARAALDQAQGRAKPAALIALGADPEQAQNLLDRNDQNLKPCLAALRNHQP